MAFMMPVVKNDWDIYNTNRSRRSSECSRPQQCRSRKVSETKSEGPCSYSTSPGSGMMSSPAHRSVPANMARAAMSSRTSQSSLGQSPCKSAASSPPKAGSQSSLNKFHTRVLDKLRRSLRRDSED